MNASEMLRLYHDGTGLVLTEDGESTILRALRLLAAAEANDGSIPEMTKAVQEGRGIELGCQFERERNGLAARVGELEPDAERYRWLLHQAPITDFIFKFLRSTERHVSNAIDAARSK